MENKIKDFYSEPSNGIEKSRKLINAIALTEKKARRNKAKKLRKLTSL